MPTQYEMFYQQSRAIADTDLLFIEMVKDGMTRSELQRNIDRRPALWSRFAGWLSRLPE